MTSARYDRAVLKHDLAALSDPAKDQYFLTNPAKLQVILDAADIRETDRVVEIGAGAGTVARVLPRSASLTLIELDERLIPTLRNNAPDHASVLNADGLALLQQGQLHADVILGNLPNEVAEDLTALLPRLDFRVAVVAAGSVEPFEALSEHLNYSLLADVWGDDFTPSQPGLSHLISVHHRQSSTK